MAQQLPIGGFVELESHGWTKRAVLVDRAILEDRLSCALVRDDGTLSDAFEIDPSVRIRYLGESYTPPAITPVRRGQRRYGPNQPAIVVDVDW